RGCVTLPWDGSARVTLYSARPYRSVRFSFFFSSRRRHTRCYRDWSSDVCSSDLVTPPPRHRASPRRRSAAPEKGAQWKSESKTRSEERRVGKECRTEW